MWCPDGYGHMGGWGMAWMSLTSIVVLGAIVAGILLLVRYLGKPGPATPASPHVSAEQLLAERYARGEIDEQEYQQRLSVLRGSQKA